MIKGAFLFLLMLISCYTHAITSMIWEKRPLAIPVPFDQEQIVVFPKPISVVDSELGELVYVMKLKDTLYLKAKSTFQDKRLVVQLMPEGEVIILNLSSSQSAPSDLIQVGLAEESPSLGYQAHHDSDSNPIGLTRFAIHALYASERFNQTPKGVHRIAMQTTKTVGLMQEKIRAYPLASWKGGDLYVTAVELKNTVSQPLKLDPKAIQGRWESAAFYPGSILAPKGKASTTVFLTSRFPFKDALVMNQEFIR